MKNRIVSFLLAVVFLLALCASAYAADETATVPGVSQQSGVTDDTVDEGDEADGPAEPKETEPNTTGEPSSDGDSDPSDDVSQDDEEQKDADAEQSAAPAPTEQPAAPATLTAAAEQPLTPVAAPAAAPAAAQPAAAAAPVAEITDGWVRQNGEWFYLKEREKMTGWQTIGGRQYYFRTGGDPEWTAQKDAGALAEGLLWLGGRNWYYFDSNASDPAKVTMVKNAFRKVDDAWSYFGADGKRVTGWQTINGKQYYFRTDSKNEWSAQDGEYDMAEGLLWLGGRNWYFFDSDGKDPASVTMVKNAFRWVDGAWSYFGADGKRVTGWQTINGKQYYFRTGSKNEWSAQDGEYDMAEGLLWLGGRNWYYFDSNGGDPAKVTMVKNAFRRVDGAWSYFGADGKRVTGWQTINGKQYYFRTSSSREWSAQNGEYNMVEGLLWLGGRNWYYFDSNSSDATKVTMVKNAFRWVDGGWSYFGSDGKRVTGWQTIGGKRFYFYTSGSSEYCQALGLTTIDGKRYYFDHDQGMLTGWQTIDGKQYYFDSNGTFASGLTWMNNGWYCFDSNGQLQTNRQVVLGIKTYTTDGSGKVVGFNGSKQAVDVLNRIGWDLKAAYNWAAGLRYANRWYRADSVDAYANYGFSNGYGNCYVMNSCLYKLAQALGYEVKFMSGAVRNSNGYDAPHGWCEINDGGWYVFDSNFHNETGRNGYRISYGQSGTWVYVKYGYLA